MISAEEARQRQYNIQKQYEQARIEFDAKHTYLDENGKKQYYSLESFEDIMNMIDERCKSCEDTSVEVRNRLHPDTVIRLKEAGYRIFLTKYEGITYTWIYTIVSWGGVPENSGNVVEL